MKMGKNSSKKIQDLLNRDNAKISSEKIYTKSRMTGWMYLINKEGEFVLQEIIQEPQPQLEIKSRQQHEDDRIIVLSEAIAGALKEGKEVDLEWGKELNDLLERKRNYDQPSTTYFVGPNSQTRIVPNHPYHGINGPVH